MRRALLPVRHDALRNGVRLPLCTTWCRMERSGIHRKLGTGLRTPEKKPIISNLRPCRPARQPAPLQLNSNPFPPRKTNTPSLKMPLRKGYAAPNRLNSAPAKSGCHWKRPLRPGSCRPAQQTRPQSPFMNAPIVSAACSCTNTQHEAGKRYRTAQVKIMEEEGVTFLTELDVEKTSKPSQLLKEYDRIILPARIHPRDT